MTNISSLNTYFFKKKEVVGEEGAAHKVATQSKQLRGPPVEERWLIRHLLDGCIIFRRRTVAVNLGQICMWTLFT